jgi:hypothetical protein
MDECSSAYVGMLSPLTPPPAEAQMERDADLLAIREVIVVVVQSRQDQIRSDLSTAGDSGA